MRVLLTTLNSRYSHSNLAIRSLYAAGIKTCPDLNLREFTINNDPDYVFMELLREDYDVIFFSCYIWNIEIIKYLCENLKKARPDIHLVAGGPEVSFDCRNFLEENPAFDAVIYGEGEYSFALVLKALKQGRPLFSDIKGLAYRKGEDIRVNQPMPPLKFDSLPFPYSVIPAEEDKIIYYESTRGCPYRCSYCLSSIDKTVRALPLDRVKTDLAYFLYREVKQVKFIDRTFNWDKERAYDIMKYLALMDNGITNFHFELAGELIDERMIDLVRNSRKDLFQFEIGIQSTNQLTLKAVNRNSRLSESFENIRALSLTGKAHVHVDLIVGLPFEDFDSLRISFNNIYTLNADMIQVGFLKMLKGTAIRFNEKYYEYTYRSKAPYEVISNGFMAASEISRMKQFENVLDLYYNRGGFERTLEYIIESADMTPFDMYLEFSDYYYLKGYQHRNQSKENLYRILNGYIKWKSRHCDMSYEKAAGYLESDLRDRLNEDAVKKFMKKGWEYPGEKTWQENIKD